MSKIKKLRTSFLSVALCFSEIQSISILKCLFPCCCCISHKYAEASDNRPISPSLESELIEMRELPPQEESSPSSEAPNFQSQEPTPDEIEATVRFLKEHSFEPDPSLPKITLEDPDGTKYEISLLPPRFEENSINAAETISRTNSNIGYLRTCKANFEEQLGFLEKQLEKSKVPVAKDYAAEIKHFLKRTKRYHIVFVRDFLIYYQKTVQDFKRFCRKFQRDGPLPMPAKIMILRYNLEHRLDEACEKKAEISIEQMNIILEQLDQWLIKLDKEIETCSEKIDRIDIHLNFRKKFYELISKARSDVSLLTSSSEITPITVKENLLKSFYELLSILPPHYNEFLSLLYQIELKFEDFGALVGSYIGTMEIVPYSNQIFETSGDVSSEEDEGVESESEEEQHAPSSSGSPS